MNIQRVTIRLLVPLLIALMTLPLLASITLAAADSPLISDTADVCYREKDGDGENGDGENGDGENGADNELGELGALGRQPRGVAGGSAAMYSNNLFVSAPQALPGQVVQVSSNVCNNGSAGKTYSAVFYVNGRAEQSQAVGVSPGACKLVVFYFVRSVPGQYQVAVDGAVGYVNVLAPRLIMGTMPTAAEDNLGTGGIICIVVVLGTLIIAIVYIERMRGTSQDSTRGAA
jgi:hypothetical protein